MARKARLKFAGLPLHVIQRGNNRGPCFVTDNDRLVYLALLDKYRRLYDCSIHAYVLMGNHVHLLLSPAGIDGASLLMKHLGQEYVQYFNRAHQRSGSLWEGRFRSSIVDSNGYLLRCYRYVELNPVRAGLVSSPGEYLWSSFRANAWGQASPLVEPHPCFDALGATGQERAAAYLGTFGTPMSTASIGEIRNAANGGFALGGDAFLDDLAASLGRPVARRRQRSSNACSLLIPKAE